MEGASKIETVPASEYDALVDILDVLVQNGFGDYATAAHEIEWENDPEAAAWLRRIGHGERAAELFA